MFVYYIRTFKPGMMNDASINILGLAIDAMTMHPS